MDDAIKQKLVRYLDVMEDAASRGADFVVEQAPETIQQWVAFTVVSELVLSLLFLGISCGLWAGYCVLWKASRRLASSMDETGMWLARGATVIFVAMFSALSFIEGFIPHAQKFLMAWLAPNVFILKELAGLIK